jgi:tRNA(Ile)-lysidine synthase
VSALHVNYGLREAAAGDEEHCREFGQALGVPVHVHTAHRSTSVGNLQAWAREERYRAACALAGGLDADVAAGHTASDQVETILYRLASSPSRRALLGMRSREGRLIRPLLGFTRRDTAEYCLEHGLKWREDESNQSGTHARARVRHRLVPALREIHPAAEKNILALSAILRDEAEVLDVLVEQALAGRSEIEVQTLRGLALPVQRLVLQRLADAAVGRPAPGTARRAEEVTALGSDAALDLPHGVRAVTQGGVLRFQRQEEKGHVRPGESAP